MAINGATARCPQLITWIGGEAEDEGGEHRQPRGRGGGRVAAEQIRGAGEERDKATIRVIARMGMVPAT